MNQKEFHCSEFHQQFTQLQKQFIDYFSTETINTSDITTLYSDILSWHESLEKSEMKAAVEYFSGKKQLVEYTHRPGLEIELGNEYHAPFCVGTFNEEADIRCIRPDNKILLTTRLDNRSTIGQWLYKKEASDKLSVSNQPRSLSAINIISEKNLNLIFENVVIKIARSLTDCHSVKLIECDKSGEIQRETSFDKRFNDYCIGFNQDLIIYKKYKDEYDPAFLHVHQFDKNNFSYDIENYQSIDISGYPFCQIKTVLPDGTLVLYTRGKKQLYKNELQFYKRTQSGYTRITQNKFGVECGLELQRQYPRILVFSENLFALYDFLEGKLKFVKKQEDGMFKYCENIFEDQQNTIVSVIGENRFIAYHFDYKQPISIKEFRVLDDGSTELIKEVILDDPLITENEIHTFDVNEKGEFFIQTQETDKIYKIKKMSDNQG